MLMLRSFLRRLVFVLRLLVSMELSSEQDTPVSLQARNHTRPLVYRVPGHRRRVIVRKEVVLSAGVFNTPQLLMLSGIGDSSELRSLGIATRVNLPSVGKNMTDHVFLTSPWQVNTKEIYDSYLTPDAFPRNIREWNRTHQGPLSYTIANQMAWIRLPQNDTIIQTYGDPSPGQTSAHYQFIWSSGWGVTGVTKPEGNWMTIATNLISPTSRK